MTDGLRKKRKNKFIQIRRGTLKTIVPYMRVLHKHLVIMTKFMFLVLFKTKLNNMMDIHFPLLLQINIEILYVCVSYVPYYLRFRLFSELTNKLLYVVTINTYRFSYIITTNFYRYSKTQNVFSIENI